MKEPEVSVIVTAYNVALYLEACVRSILRQTMPDFEMILVEDCSTDGTRAEAERLALMDERIRLVCHEQNFGVSAGRNKGLSLARGRYIMFVDGDDWLEDTCMASLLRVADEQRADLVMTGYIAMEQKEDGSWQEQRRSVYQIREPLLSAKGRKRHCAMWAEKYFNLTVWAKLYRRSFMEKAELTFAPDVRLIEDILFSFCVLCRAERIVWVPGGMYRYRQTEESITRGKNSPARFREGLQSAIAAGRVMDAYINSMPEVASDSALCEKLRLTLGRLYYKYVFMDRAKGLLVSEALLTTGEVLSEEAPAVAPFFFSMLDAVLRKGH